MNELPIAANVRFDLATDISSSRLRGGNTATEHILEIEGEVGGSPRRRRSTIEFTKGQAALTGLSAVLSLSTVLGLEGRPPAPASDSRIERNNSEFNLSVALRHSTRAF